MAHNNRNRIYNVDHHREQFNEIMWGEVGGLDPPLSESRTWCFGETRIRHIIEIITSDVSTLRKNEKMMYYNYKRTYEVQEVPVSEPNHSLYDGNFLVGLQVETPHQQTKTSESFLVKNTSSVGSSPVLMKKNVSRGTGTIHHVE